MKDTQKNKSEEIYAICHDCGKEKEWEPVDFAVGQWVGECQVCGKIKSCTAQRDYKLSTSNPYGR